ncbi:MAG: radical SAM protein [Clostridia bacterium]|nr:radical SAM protein [Clostridia bacterium]
MKDVSFCEFCPRKCPVDRVNKLGFCGANNKILINKIMLHYWEEPIISGTEKTPKKGSGAIFFGHCNLKCVYCQNYDISHGNFGKYYSSRQLANVFKRLEKQGATNINLVTPTHYSLYILQALKIYKPSIPVVWNTGGYESPKVIHALNGYVDIFLTDFKYFDDNLAIKYSHAPNYYQTALNALKAMKEVVPKDEIKNGLMQKGIIVRHLVLPNHTDDSIKVLNTIKEVLGKNTIISLMSQYVPVGKAKDYPEINRRLKPVEYKIVKNHMYKLGLDGFVQEMDSASTQYIPDFDTK